MLWQKLKSFLLKKEPEVKNSEKRYRVITTVVDLVEKTKVTTEEMRDTL